MKKNHFWVILCIVLVIGLIIYFWSRPSLPSASATKSESIPVPQSTVQTPGGTPVAQQQTEQGRPLSDLPDRSIIEKTIRAFAQPISFWGKIVDEKGNSVADAEVMWSANNNPDPYGSGTKGQTTSGADGMFFITSHGIGLYVEVSKAGYYRVPTESRRKLGSSGSFDNAGLVDNTDSPMGTRENPTIFTIRKMGQVVPLIQVTERPIRIPKNGTPVEVNLATGQPVVSDQGGLKVECWTNDQSKDAKGQYAWRCQLSVPGGGGLIERTDPYAFEAPTDGYKSSIELGPPSDQWSARAERQYFVKLPDNRYARIDFRIRTGGDHYFVIESYLNPTPGSRNLEFDSSKAINP